MMVYMIVIPVLGRGRQADAQNSLANQPSQVDEFQANERPCLKKKGELQLKNRIHTCICTQYLPNDTPKNCFLELLRGSATLASPRRRLR